MLFTDYRTSNESRLAKHSHLLPIQPSRTSSLLPSLLGGTCSTNHWVTPSIIDRYKPGSTEFLQVLSISGDTASLIEGGYAIHFMFVFFSTTIYTSFTMISASPPAFCSPPSNFHMFTLHLHRRGSSLTD